MPSNKKKKFMVMARNEKIQTSGIKTGKGHRSFGEKSVLWISDPAEAREIETEYGMKGKRQVAVTTDQQYEWSLNNDGQNGTKLNNIHKYTFLGVDMSGIRTEKDNGLVWARIGGSRQVLVRREEAMKNGYEIVEKKRVAAQGAEAK